MNEQEKTELARQVIQKLTKEKQKYEKLRASRKDLEPCSAR